MSNVVDLPVVARRPKNPDGEMGEIAEVLADLYMNHDFAGLTRSFKRYPPLFAAALALHVYTRLPPSERSDYYAIVTGFGQPIG